MENRRMKLKNYVSPEFEIVSFSEQTILCGSNAGIENMDESEYIGGWQ